MAAQNKLDSIKTIHDEDVDIKNRRIYIFTDINEESAKKTVQSLHFLEQSEGEISIYFNTPGGGWDEGIAIFNAIKSCKNHVVGYVLGSCSSMGSVILQACDKRIMEWNTSMLIHPGNAGADATVPDFISRAAWEKKILNMMFDIYYERIKLTKGEDVISMKKLRLTFSKDRYIFSKEAMAFGLIDEINKQE